jgi:hypothetical protein
LSATFWLVWLTVRVFGLAETVAWPDETEPPVGRLCACAVVPTAMPKMARPASRAMAVDADRALLPLQLPADTPASSKTLV